MDLLVLKTWLQGRFSTNQRGAALVEYAMLLLFVAVFCLISVMYFGQATSAKLNTVNVSMN